jgi:hypothetical protein
MEAMAGFDEHQVFGVAQLHGTLEWHKVLKQGLQLGTGRFHTIRKPEEQFEDVEGDWQPGSSRPVAQYQSIRQCFDDIAGR